MPWNPNKIKAVAFPTQKLKPLDIGLNDFGITMKRKVIH